MPVLLASRHHSSLLTSGITNRSLYKIGAKLKKSSFQANVNFQVDSKLELTPLGYHLSRLPVDVRIGKLMIFGAFFRFGNFMACTIKTLRVRNVRTP
jgi:hypothetical protein